MIFLALGAAAGMILASRLLLHYFQLESYQFQGYFRTLMRQWKKALLPGAALSAAAAVLHILLSLICKDGLGGVSGYLLAASAGLMIVAAGLLLQKKAMNTPQKKKFVITARVKRLYAVHGLVCLAAALSVSLLPGFGSCAWVIGLPAACFLLPLLVALSGVLAMPIEKLIFSLYFHDAEKKLLENDKLIRIGITGSYGKTSTKFILANILSQKYNVLATPASFNTPMGVTRIIRERLTPSHQVFIGEMGARHVGEIKELSRLVHPQIGVLTAVGPQHLDTFRTIERIEKTKYELIDALPSDGFSVFLHDDAIVTKLYEKTEKPKAIAGKENGDVWAENVHLSSQGSHFTLRIKGWEPVECTAPLLGEHNIRNILMSCAVAVHLGLNKEQIVRGIATLKPIEHRLQLLRSQGDITVIDDAFNTNPRSSKEALKVLSMFPGRRVIVTPGMVELGADEDKYNYEFGQAMAKAVDMAVLVGKKHTLPIQKGLKDAGFPEENIHVMASLDEAIAFNRQNLRAGDVVMYENDLPDNYSEG
ncbi:MAG: UDP-N-acetylmuramoyl-tripeptide--D-alanyl-D-alanine ligase [Clostridia bacterium]|nr:UDP-N-acetylmuramoyl-tripeptide--D-alanyl-D-alanine ligase [Clostridia bacterium]